MGQEHWILNGHEPVSVPLLEWAAWFENNYEQRRVSNDILDGHRISTVFLGIDHSLGDDGPPLLFETMVFEEGTWNDIYCEQCSTWDEAVAQHQKAIAWVKDGQKA